MSGIQVISSYLPKFRMQRSIIADQLAWYDASLKNQAKGTRSVANWDEDAITMAVAAARKTQIDFQESVSKLVFASTSMPFLDRSNSTLIAEVLSMDEQVRVFDSSGSQRAASSILLSSLDDAAPATTLLTAADRRGAPAGSPLEMRYGDAATSVISAADDGIARYLGGASIARDFIDHYRSEQQASDYILEDRWVRDEGVSKLVPQTIQLALNNAQLTPQKIDQLVLPMPIHHAKAVVKILGLEQTVLADNLYSEIGDTGVGHGLLMLDQALHNAHAKQIICLVGFGQGCDVMLFEVTPKVVEHKKASSPSEQAGQAHFLENYLKLPAFSRQLRLATGIRAEADKRTSISAYYRHHSAINAMMGSVCSDCGTPHFPPARICVNCHAADQMQDYSFADKTATIKSFTEDWQTATPSPPMCYGNVAFAGGGNAFMELSDVITGSLQVGSELNMQFRIKDYDDARGFRRYFWKPVMIESSSLIRRA